VVPGILMRKLSLKMVDAVIANDVAAVAKLLDAGKDVNARNESGETAFSYACANNAFDVAKLLHSRGADINTVDKGNGSPLDWASCHSSPEFCAWLESVGGKRHDLWPPTESGEPAGTT
jgi:ankyrin repeat protein